MSKDIGRELPEIRKTVIINASINKVWKTVSTSEEIARWWMPNTLEATMGKEFVLRDEKFGDSVCRVTELDPPNLLGFDWDETWHLTFKLRSLGETRTEFTLIHSGWPEGEKNRVGIAYSVVREIMNDGWEKTVLVRLAKYLDG